MRFLSNKEKKELQEKLPKGYAIDKKDTIKEQDNILYKENNKLLIIDDNHNLLPHMLSVNESEYKAVYVDKGAIPFIIKGADLMRPGITKIDTDIKENEIILIKDENHSKILAIGFALLSSENMQKQDKGKSVKIYHYFKDKHY